MDLKQSQDLIRKHFEESIVVKTEVLKEHDNEVLGTIAMRMADALEAGGKILFCGNGGSASDAQHLAAEFLVRLRSSFNRGPLPALALHVDTSTLTACANDYGFDVMYARMVEALGNTGDVLVGLSTSGKSPNVIKALDAAKAKNIYRVGFLGSGGGPALEHCDTAFVVPSGNTLRIQESHITAGHAVIETVEEILASRGKIKRL